MTRQSHNLSFPTPSTMSADDAVARAKEIAARLSGASVPAPPNSALLDVADAAQAAIANGASAPAATERKRKRWGTADDKATPALPGLDMVEKKLKAASEPVQKRVWVNTSQNPAAHYVSFVSDTKIQGIVAQVGGGDSLKIELKGRGSKNSTPLPGMPEEPLHILIDGPPDLATKAETMVDDLLREAENAPVTVTEEPAGQADSNGAQSQQVADAAKAADAIAAALNTGAIAAAPASAGYKPAPVAQLIGQTGNSGAAGIYGPGGGTGETFEEQIGVPNGVVGFIIGRGGESITSMQARSGCRVQIQKEHEMTPGQTQRVITLTSSSKESIDMCRGMIEAMVQDRIREAGGGRPGGIGTSVAAGSGAASQAAKLQEAITMGHVLVTVQVPDADVGLIIGKMGANIKSIQDRSGANVQIPQTADVDNPSVRTVNVTHPHPEGANLAKQMIEDLLRSKASNQGGAGANITLQVPIPDQDVGMCIGRSGCVIREMQNKSGTRIQIPSQPTPGQTHRIATVTGSQEGCQQVQQMINTIIQEQSSHSVMQGANYSGGYNNAYGQQQTYGQQYGASYGQQAAGGQKDYSAEWAAYYAAQAAAQQSGTPAAAPATASAATTTAAAPASSTNGDAQPAADAYYDQFFRYAYHYGEEAARQYYTSWAPPPGTPNPYGTNPNAPTAAPAPADAPQAAPAPAPATGGSTVDAAAIAAAAAGARDTSVRKQSNLPAWMTKGTS